MEHNNINPELEAKTKYLKGSTLDKIFDVLTTAGYAAGGVDYYRQQAAAEADSDIERSLINAAYGVPVLGLAVGLTSKSGREAAAYGIENRLEVARVREVDSFWAGLATNIAYDPASYVGVGAVKNVVGKVGMRGIRMLPNAARSRALVGASKIAKFDAAVIAAKARVTNTAMEPVRKTAAFVKRGIITGTGGAGRRIEKVLRSAGGKLGGARDVFGQVFEPGYKLKQLGPRMKDVVESWQDMVVSRRGKVSQAAWEAKELGKSYKRKGEAAMDYLEGGISTGIADLDKYLDDTVKPYLDDIRTKELGAGYDIGEVLAYAPHILTKKGEKFFEKHGGEEGALQYIKEQAQIQYGKERTFGGTAREINELFGEEVFMTDLWEAISIRSQRSASDRATTSWLREIQEKYGIEEGERVVEESLTAAAEKIPQKMRKFQILVASLTGTIDDVIAGKSTGGMILGELETAAKSGVFSVSEFRGKAAAWRSRITDISTYSQQITRARRNLKSSIEDIGLFERDEANELARGGVRSGSRISRGALESLERMYQGAAESAERSTELIKVGKERLSGEAMGLQEEIIDPLNRYISNLATKGKETKTLRTIKEQTDDVIDYVQTKRSDITTKLPSDVAKYLDDLEETRQKQDPIIEGAYQKYKWMMTKWKKTVTLGIGPLVRTAFFGRNVATGIAQNIQEIGYARTARGIFTAARLALGKGTFETLEHGTVGPEEMQKLMRESGQMSSTGISDVDLEDTMFPSVIQKIWNIGGSLMKWTEAMVREPLFTEQIRKNTLEETAKSVKRTHFDYAPEALTPVERALKMVAFPFYTFSRFNLERQTRKLVSDPKGFNDLGKIQREAIRAGGMEEEFEELEDWQRDLYLVPNPIHPGQFISLPMPQTALNLNPGAFYFQLNPLKQLLEMGAVGAGWGSVEYKAARTKALFDEMMFGSQKRQFEQLTDSETSTKKKITTAMGLNTYDPNTEVVSFEEFEQYRYRMVQPTKQQEYEAWVEAGSPKGFRVIKLGPAIGQIGTESDITIKAPWWKFWQKDEIIEAIEHDFELGIVTPEIYEMGKGYPWDDASWAQVNKFQGAERTAAITKLVVEWDAYKQAQYSVEGATVKQQMEAWERSGRPENATSRIYRNKYGDLLGIASYDRKEIDKLNEYADKNIRISNAAYEWAFVQSDMNPEEFILSQLDKENQKYLAVNAAKEELRGFNVDEPVAASEVNMTQQIEYSAYRQNRVDYEQNLIEKALSRGETL